MFSHSLILTDINELHYNDINSIRIYFLQTSTQTYFEESQVVLGHIKQHPESMLHTSDISIVSVEKVNSVQCKYVLTITINMSVITHEIWLNGVKCKTKYPSGRGWPRSESGCLRNVANHATRSIPKTMKPVANLEWTLHIL